MVAFITHTFLAKVQGKFYLAEQAKTYSPPSCCSLYIKLFWGNVTHVTMTLEKKKTIRRKQTPETRLVKTQWWPGSREWWSSYFFWLFSEGQVFRARSCAFGGDKTQSGTDQSVVCCLLNCSVFSHSCPEERWQDSWRVWVSKKFSALPSVTLHWVQLLWRHSSVWWVGALCCALQNKVSAHFPGNAFLKKKLASVRGNPCM